MTPKKKERHSLFDDKSEIFQQKQKQGLRKKQKFKTNNNLLNYYLKQTKLKLNKMENKTETEMAKPFRL